MSDETTSSGRPELLLAGGAIAVVVAAAAWFMLGGGDSDDSDLPLPVVAEKKVEQQPTEITVSASSGESIDTLLNKARMAVSADMLAEPAGQNALHFYSLALESDPENAEVQEELGVVTTEVSSQIKTRIDSKDFKAASELVQRLEVSDASLPIIGEYYLALEQEQQSISDQAMDAAKAGRQSRVDRLVAELSEMPGGDTPLQALATELRQIEIDREEERRAERERAAAEAAALAAANKAAEPAATAADNNSTAPWQAAYDAAAQQVSDGDLLGSNSAQGALASLASNYSGVDEISALQSRWIDAVSAKAQREIALEQLDSARLSLAALTEVGAPVAELTTAAELAEARVQARQVVSANELTLIDIVQPVYPRLAKRGGVEGWVEVEFTVNKDGRVENIVITNTSNSTTFNRATIQAVSQWVFEPKTFDGKPISQRVATRVAFRLS